MASDPTQSPRHASCPACGAALRPGSPWCTLCYTDLRPPEQRPAPPVPTAAPPTATYGEPAGDPLTQPLLDFIAPAPQAGAPGITPKPVARASGWPCLSCGASNPLEAETCLSCGASFLADLGQASRPSYVLPIVGDVSRLSRAQRIGGALALSAMVILPVALISLLLSEEAPPEDQPRPPATQAPFVPGPATAPVTPAPTAVPTGFPTPTATVLPTVTP